jgi:hypothetical protein
MVDCVMGYFEVLLTGLGFWRHALYWEAAPFRRTSQTSIITVGEQARRVREKKKKREARRLEKQE